MVSIRYFIDVWYAWPRKFTPLAAVTSTKLAEWLPLAAGLALAAVGVMDWFCLLPAGGEAARTAPRISNNTTTLTNTLRQSNPLPDLLGVLLIALLRSSSGSPDL